MKRWLPFPLLWALLLAMWLTLYRTLAVGHVLLAAITALAAVLGFRRLQAPVARLRRPSLVVQLAWRVFIDVVRSNVAVAGIVLRPGPKTHTPGFVDIPLALRNPVGLAVLACIVTATPGTAWAGYDPGAGVLTLHVLDLVDEDASVRMIRQRYETLLLEIFL